MALSQEDKKEIINAIKAESTGIDELTVATSLDGVMTLPAIRGTEVVSVPVALLSKPAVDAAAAALNATKAADDAAFAADSAGALARSAAEEATAAAQKAKSAVVEFRSIEPDVAQVVSNSSSTHLSTDRGCRVVYNSASARFVLAVSDLMPAAESGVAPASALSSDSSGSGDVQAQELSGVTCYSNWADADSFGQLSAEGRIPEAGKIYLCTDENKIYRWSGSELVEIPIGLALGYTSGTAFPGNDGLNLDNAVNAVKKTVGWHTRWLNYLAMLPADGYWDGTGVQPPYGVWLCPDRDGGAIFRCFDNSDFYGLGESTYNTHLDPGSALFRIGSAICAIDDSGRFKPVSVTEEATRQVFIDMWCEAWGKLGGYDSEATDGCPFIGNGLRMDYETALRVFRLHVPGRDSIMNNRYMNIHNVPTLLPIYTEFVTDCVYMFCNAMSLTHLHLAMNVKVANNMFSGCTNLREITGLLNIVGCNTDYTVADMFKGCKALENLNLHFLSHSISFADSPNLSLDSILYMVENANNKAPITITLHPQAYARLTDEIIDLASSRQISFATIQ